MPKISQATIDAIRERANIVEVVEPYTQLRRSGSQYRGLSPFNEEKTPSFYVHPEKNVFKCYSSGHAGDIFGFVQLKENLPFHEAAERLANQFGIPMAYESSGASDSLRSLSQALLQLHEVATEFFYHQFSKKTSEGQVAQAYWLKERSLSQGSADALRIGVAPARDEGELIKQLLARGGTPEAVAQSGLFYTKTGSCDPRFFRPRFRGRLMIPIRDVQGRVVAFTARVLSITPQDDPTHEAKYINSPETPLFKKSQLVFGLDHARLHLKPQSGGSHELQSPNVPILLVEGQLDVIRCWETGLHTAVAAQGTSVTEDQLHLLRRYSGSLNVVMDGDAAGTKAALRLLPMGIKAGFELHFIALPTQEDPDSFLKKEGIFGWKQLESKRQDAIDFALQVLAVDGRRSSPHVKEAALRHVFEIYSKTSSKTLIENALRQSSAVLGVSYDAIQHEFHQLKVVQAPVENKKSLNEALTSVESILLIGFSSDREIANGLAKAVASEWLDRAGLAGRLLDRFLGAFQEGLWKDRGSADELFENDDERNYFYSLLASDHLDPSALRSACKQAFQALFQRHFEAIKRSFSRQLALVEPTDYEKLKEFQSERIRIRRILEQPPQLDF